MILAETVVAFATGTIAEFKVGVVGVGASAYGTLAGVALVLCFGVSLFCSFLEIDHVGVALIAVFAAYGGEGINEHISAENEVIENCGKGNESEKYLACDQSGADGNDKKCGIQISQPLDFNGDDEKQQYTAFGEEGCKYEEHGEIDIRGIKENVSLLTEKTGDHSVYYSAEYTAKVVQCELTGTPVALKGVADEVVEVKGNRQSEKIAAGRDEYKGYKTPHLTLEYKLGIKNQIRKEAAGSIHHEEQIDNNLADDDEQHEISYSEIWVFGAKTINGCGQFFHIGPHCECITAMLQQIWAFVY